MASEPSADVIGRPRAAKSQEGLVSRAAQLVT